MRNECVSLPLASANSSLPLASANSSLPLASANGSKKKQQYLLLKKVEGML